MTRTYRWTAQISDGRHHDGKADGTVQAGSENEARRLVADWVRDNGARKKRTWTATHIELS
jgi:hypothetical protein